jgi:preprotein translocase subunit SecD
MKVPFRIWVLVVALILAVIAINPNPWAEGIEIQNVDSGSDAYENGLRNGMILYAINGEQVEELQDFQDIVSSLEYSEKNLEVVTSYDSEEYLVTNDLGFVLNENLTILSSQHFDIEEDMKLLELNGVEIESYDDYTDFISDFIPYNTFKIETGDGEFAFLSRETLDFTVSEATKTNLALGLDLQGGTRVLLKPVSDEEITDTQLQDLISVMSNRLNVYGLSDIVLRSAEDWEGNKYVLVEIAGVTQDEVRDLISQQGKFEAFIGTDLVFEGGEEDILYVCRNDGSCSGVRDCSQISGDQWYCSFEFSITLSQEAADAQAAATENLDIVYAESGKAYLNETVDFYLDGELVDSLNIGEDLKGKATTTIAISGPGYGSNKMEAVENTMANMDQLQTILITGSMPFDIEIAQLDSVAPSLGESFLKNVLWAGLFAMLGVALVVFLRFRSFKVVGPMIFTILSEITLILGFAALVGWNLDVAAIAGILAAIGTGVDHQIVIVDEAVKGQDEKYSNWAKKLKRAFFIIFVAYATTVAAMLPLWNAGAGLIRGFAVTTIAGVTIGVFLTRPAFAALVEELYKNE